MTIEEIKQYIIDRIDSLEIRESDRSNNFYFTEEHAVLIGKINELRKLLNLMDRNV